MTQAQELSIEELFAVAEISFMALKVTDPFSSPKVTHFKQCLVQCQPKIAVIWVSCSLASELCWSHCELQALRLAAQLS